MESKYTDKIKSFDLIGKHRYQDGDIVLWMRKHGKEYTIEDAWFEDGLIKIPQKVIDAMSEMNLDEIIDALKEVRSQGKFYCSKCGLIITKSEVDHEHFAGRYCKECSKKYRELYSRLCTICNTPLHSCTC